MCYSYIVFLTRFFNYVTNDNKKVKRKQKNCMYDDVKSELSYFTFYLNLLLVLIVKLEFVCIANFHYKILHQTQYLLGSYIRWYTMCWKAVLLLHIFKMTIYIKNHFIGLYIIQLITLK